MRPQFRFSFVLMTLLALGLTSRLEAAEAKSTVITVGEMCGGCVKKITAKFNGFADVDKVQCDVKAKTVTVIPKAGKTLSPRTLWEAMESIGKKPKQLAGPDGTFTSKPNS